MPFDVAKKNVALDAMFPVNNIIYVSLHSASPPTLLNEIPGTVRQSATLAPAANGQKACTVQPAQHDVPAGTTVAAIGYYDAATNGNRCAWFDNADEVFGASGKAQVTINPFTLNDVAGA